eukprot:14421012-Heterocapsa_arctica.AAC.1
MTAVVRLLGHGSVVAKPAVDVQIGVNAGFWGRTLPAAFQHAVRVYHYRGRPLHALRRPNGIME